MGEPVGDKNIDVEMSSASSNRAAVAMKETEAIDASASNVDSMKQVKVAAKLEQMREKLAAMGILAGDRGPTPDMEYHDTDNETEIENHKRDQSYNSANDGNDTEDEEDPKEKENTNTPDDLKYLGTLSAFPSDGTILAALKAEDTEETVTNLNIPSDTILAAGLADEGAENTTSITHEVNINEETQDKEELPERRMTESISSDGGTLAMRKKTEECRRIMSELSVMTSRAAKAFSDLNDLRTSVSQSISMKESASPLRPGVDKSVVFDNPEVDSLFSDFRSSISTLVNLASMIDKDSSICMDTSVNETSEMDKSLVAGASVNTTSTTASGNHESSASATMTGTPQPPDAETMKMLESYG